MKSQKCRYAILTALLFSSQFSFAQSSGGGNNLLLYSLIGLGILLLVWAVLNLTDNLMQIEAKKRGADTSKDNYSLFPRFSELFGKKAPAYAKGENFVNLTKGHNIKLEGEVTNETIESVHPSRVAIKPIDYRGIAPIPKVVVVAGDEVLAGDEIFYDKRNPEIKYVTPVSGEIVEVKRGPKRAIEEIIILVDKKQKHKQFDVPSLDNLERGDLVDFLCASGLWTSINQRPFDQVADRNTIPKNIFISTFDTAPLAMSQEVIVSGNEKEFQKGLDVLTHLTSGDVHLGLSANGQIAPNPAFANAEGVKKHYFGGKHPAGNVGIHIHHIAPISANNIAWTMDVQDVINIGFLFLTGKFNGSQIVGIKGSQVNRPKYIKTLRGANIGELTNGNLNTEEKVRLIDGNVLTGATTSSASFLSAGSDLITAIKEGDYYEMFGWLLPIKPRPTVSRTFPNFLFPGHEFEGDTNTHGERRAFVVTGQYESVLPMNVYPQHIMKAIMTNDFEKMEGLGLAELSEEDVALCEFVCTSKMPLQSILRQGLDMMKDQI